MVARGRGLEFCCFALPLINFGSYTICLEFIFVALCVALLAIGPPSIVATQDALPAGWPKFVVLILGIIIVLWQILGLVSIKRENTSLYRTYIRINFLLTLLTIIVTLAFFAVAAARHSVALQSCVAQYGSTPAGSGTSTASTGLNDIGSTICNIFLWVQVGFMGLLIALIGLTQLYMCYCQRAYGQEMRRAENDHKAFTGQNAEGIPLANRGSGIWDANAVAPTQGQRSYEHQYGDRPASDGSGSQEDLAAARMGGYTHRSSAAPPANPYQSSYASYGQDGVDSHDTNYQRSYEDHQQYGARQPLDSRQHY